MRIATRGFVALGLAGLLAVACTSSPERASVEEPRGPVIRFGYGHFAKDTKSFRYWDKDPAIPAACAKCHAADGLAIFLREGQNPPAPHVKGYGFACTNCHLDAHGFALLDAPRVTFASGVAVDSGERGSNLCLQCHRGRESGASVDRAIAGKAADAVGPQLAFVHVHYGPAGATAYGAVTRIGYQYAGRRYAGEFRHAPGARTCLDCHDAHGGEVRIGTCAGCHAGVKGAADLRRIRTGKDDWDGNGTVEGAAEEIAGLERELHAAIQAYARAVAGVPIAYSPAAFPYWYADRNGNGRVDPDELAPANRYSAYTPRLLQAVYNYTFSIRDPGAAHHNAGYMAQLLHDSLASLGERVPVAMGGKARP
jgi:hypothetical protein